MLRNRACWIVLGLVVAQAGIILYYRDALTEAADPATPSRVEGRARTLAIPASIRGGKHAERAAPKDPPDSKAAESATAADPLKPSAVAVPGMPPSSPVLAEIKENADKEGPAPTPETGTGSRDGPPAPKEADPPYANNAETRKELQKLAEARKPVATPVPDPTTPCKVDPLCPDVKPPAPAEPAGACVGKGPDASPMGVVPPQGCCKPLPSVVPAGENHAGPVTACPWTFRVALVEGKTHLTAQSGKEIRFRVICDQLALQAPRGNVEAQGAVRLSSSGLEGSCDRLTICWQDDQVVLDGQSQLKCHREGQDLELKAGRLSLRLTPTGTAKGVPEDCTTTTISKPKSKPDEKPAGGDWPQGVSP